LRPTKAEEINAPSGTRQDQQGGHYTHSSICMAPRSLEVAHPKAVHEARVNIFPRV